MRILFVVVYYLPSTMSSGKLIHDLAVEFHRQGHQPAVIAPDESIGSECEISIEDNIEVVRVKSGRIKSASRMIRAFNEARLSDILWKKSRKYLADRKFDLIVYYSPTIFFGSFVKRARSFYGCRSYLILRDIFPKWAFDAGVLNDGFIYRYFCRKEMEQYRAADVIGVQSPENLRYFREDDRLKRFRSEVLYNWTTLDEKNVPFSNYRQKLGLSGKLVFFYGGNIGVAQDMDNILRLAERLRNEPEAFFLLVGEGSEAGRLRQVIFDKGLTNIRVLGAVGQEEYLAMLSEFDVGLISLDRKLKTHNFPGKMLGYMYNRMPILASINPENDLREMIEENKAGLVSINGEDDLFLAHAIQLLRDRTLREDMGVNARRLLENKFSVEEAARQILSNFQQ
jgi:O26-antigen biosynthesis N-acetyl-L-fucosamine transferase